MIGLFYAPTPNGKKITIMLEECDLDYRIMPVNITRGDQFTPEFLAINPNGKIPAIVDHQGLSGIQRYQHETQRLYGVINDRLADSSYLANTYSIADMAVFPWVAAKRHHQIDLAGFPHVQRWYDQIKERPAVRKGMDVLQDQVPASFDEEAQRILFSTSNTT